MGSVVVICTTTFATNWYAEDLAQRKQDYKLRDFIHQNFVSSLDNVKAGRWWVMVTSSVMHERGLHLGFNMMALLEMGPTAVSLFGAPQFLGLWIFSAVSCSAVSLYWAHYKQKIRRSIVGRRLDEQSMPQWTRYINVDNTTMADYYGGAVGASGSLFGLSTALMGVSPKESVGLRFVPFVQLPWWVMNTIFAGGSLYCMITGAIPYISHAGHLGGMAGGVVYYLGILRPFLRRL